MIRLSCILFSGIFCIVLAGCARDSVTKPDVILNAESYLYDGLQAYARADWARAQQLFNQALSIYQGLDEQQGVLTSYINLAEVALSAHNYQAVNSHLDRAEDIAQQDSLEYYQARIRLLYALVALQQKKITEAENILGLLLPAFDGVKAETTPNAIQLAAIASRTKIAFIKQQNEALWVFRYANALKKSANKNTDMEARLLRFQSRLLLSQRSFKESESNLKRALLIYKENISRSGIAITLLELGEFYMGQGDLKDAQNYLNRSVAVFRNLRDVRKVMQVIEILVRVELELGNIQRSDELNQWLVDLKANQIEQGINKHLR